jgi:hypothetical protein
MIFSLVYGESESESDSGRSTNNNENSIQQKINDERQILPKRKNYDDNHITIKVLRI